MLKTRTLHIKYHSPTFITVRVSLDKRYLPFLGDNSMNFPCDEFLYQADTVVVGFEETHLSTASSLGLLIVTPTGNTFAKPNKQIIIVF